MSFFCLDLYCQSPLSRSEPEPGRYLHEESHQVKPGIQQQQQQQQQKQQPCLTKQQHGRTGRDRLGMCGGNRCYCGVQSRLGCDQEVAVGCHGGFGEKAATCELSHLSEEHLRLHYQTRSRVALLLDEMTSGIPSMYPSLSPSSVSSLDHTAIPSSIPSVRTSASPSDHPNFAPSSIPSLNPTFKPSSSPTSYPSDLYLGLPSIQPSNTPSAEPSYTPSSSTSSIPSFSPSSHPSSTPSVTSSSIPSYIPSQTPSVVHYSIPFSSSSPLPLIPHI